jgi:hypothetical protein
MNILFGDFNAKVGTENIFKLTIGNESLHEISNDNGVRVGNSATSKNLVIKSIMFPRCNIHKYSWTETHTTRFYHLLTERRWHSAYVMPEFSEGLTVILITSKCEGETGSEQPSCREDRYGEIQC